MSWVSFSELFQKADLLLPGAAANLYLTASQNWLELTGFSKTEMARSHWGPVSSIFSSPQQMTEKNKKF